MRNAVKRVKHSMEKFIGKSIWLIYFFLVGNGYIRFVSSRNYYYSAEF